MKAKSLVIILVLAAAAVPCFAGAVQITGQLAADFYSGPSAQEIVQTFSVGGEPIYWGFGWAVVPRRVGIQGDYLVSFFRGADNSWWLDWYSPAISASLHPFGANRFLDPFVQVGIGCAGRVFLAGFRFPDADALMISLFPFVTGGIALDLDGLLLGAKITYTPYVSSLPVTFIPAYPLGKFQVAITGGFSINW